MNKKAVSIVLTGDDLHYFTEYKQAHAELKPSDAQMALALVRQGLRSWRQWRHVPKTTEKRTYAKPTPKG